ncbi:methyltransferase domain-containing protein [Streptomyces canus]|uniref:SAM-dependent methyltransferase n=1 Tax=Streptomyces canus TaxID=58343 RepID=UPI003251D86D
MTAQQPSAVASHYRQGDLRRKIDEALDRLHPGHTTLTTDELHGVDEFHTGGHPATRELAEHLELSPGLRVLDVGSGLGGPARHLAQYAGADVTGVDLTGEYVDVARWLTDRVGLADRVRFQQGDIRTPASGAPVSGASASCRPSVSTNGSGSAAIVRGYSKTAWEKSTVA